VWRLAKESVEYAGEKGDVKTVDGGHSGEE